MPRLHVLFRCIGEAVCARGLKALMKLVPFGESLYDIAEEAYVRLKRSGEEEEQRQALAAAAGATPEQTRHEAEAVVAEIAATLTRASAWRNCTRAWRAGCEASASPCRT
jgi:hypothetical protein